MDGGATEDPYYSKLVTVTDGEWAGWQAYPGGDPFEDLAGPFYYRIDDEGRPCTRASARPTKRSLRPASQPLPPGGIQYT